MRAPESRYRESSACVREPVPPKHLFFLFGALLVVLAPAGRSQDESSLFSPGPDDVRIAHEIIEQLEKGHYQEAKIDDSFSERLLDRYIDALDPMRWYFLSADIAEFERFEDLLDDAIEKGDLGPFFLIFNRFHERRLERWQETCERLNTEFDKLAFDVDEVLELDRTDAPWPKDVDEAVDLWHKRFKSDVLNLRLADKEPDKILETLGKRYEDQVTRLKQVRSRDAFRILMNAITMGFDPHTEYFPPKDAANFDIQMSLSVTGIGALLGAEGEYTKIERIIPGGPAEASDLLKAGDRIIAVGQGDGEELVEIIGWRVDEAVELIRGEKGSVVQLRILSSSSNDVSTAETIALVRDEVKLEEQAAQSRVLDLEKDGENQHVGVIELPAFYVDFEALRNGDPDFRSSMRDVLDHLIELAEKEVDGIVVDLRNNGGGSLSEAVGPLHSLPGRWALGPGS